jgi:hypothetical protein
LFGLIVSTKTGAPGLDFQTWVTGAEPSNKAGPILGAFLILCQGWDTSNPDQNPVHFQHPCVRLQ